MIFAALYVVVGFVVYFTSVYRDRAKLRTLDERDQAADAFARVWCAIGWAVVLSFYTFGCVLYFLTRPFAWIYDRILERP
jgi:hypothetical protein